MKALALIVGMPAACRMVQHFGGTRLYVPRPENMRANHRIATLIGLEAARALCKWRQREALLIPRGVQNLREERDRALLKDAELLSVPQLARKYGLTERGVYYVFKRHRRAAATAK